jgi:hypothetical protein
MKLKLKGDCASKGYILISMKNLMKNGNRSFCQMGLNPLVSLIFHQKTPQILN